MAEVNASVLDPISFAGPQAAEVPPALPRTRSTHLQHLAAPVGRARRAILDKLTAATVEMGMYREPAPAETDDAA